jgi:hypothetical protein
MNERIKALAEQAGFKVNWQHEDVQAIKMARFEKFAELIVRECADIALNHPAKLPSNDWKGVDVPLDTSNRIKQHFGVEE